jgi:hypothetical protein
LYHFRKKYREPNKFRSSILGISSWSKELKSLLHVSIPYNEDLFVSIQNDSIQSSIY